MKDFIFSLIGAVILVILGCVIGFWLNIVITPDLPNGFYECRDCSDKSWADTERWWRKTK